MLAGNRTVRVVFFGAGNNISGSALYRFDSLRLRQLKCDIRISGASRRRRMALVRGRRTSFFLCSATNTFATTGVRLLGTTTSIGSLVIVPVGAKIGSLGRLSFVLTHLRRFKIGSGSQVMFAGTHRGDGTLRIEGTAILRHNLAPVG